MTTLITLLGITLFSLVFMVLWKAFEMRGMRSTFLPEVILKNDREIELTVRYIVKRVGMWLTFRTRSLIHKITVMFLDGGRLVRERSRMRMISALDTKGTASVFLKQVVEHKHNVRGAIGYSEVRSE